MGWNRDERASTTADAVAVRVKGCDANGFDQRGQGRVVALKIDGYLGMSPRDSAGISGDGRFGRCLPASRSMADSKGIAFDRAMQQQRLAGLAVLQAQRGRRRDALLRRARRLGGSAASGRSLSRHCCAAWRGSG